MRYFIINEKKLILFWSPKCGSTTIKNMILEYYGYYLEKDYHNAFKEKFKKSQNVINKEDIEKYSKYTKILVIRNPYHRLASAFYGKYVRINSPSTFKKNNPLNCNTFSDFVNILYNESHTNSHFLPQCSDDGFEIFKAFTTNKYVIEIDQMNIISNLLQLEYKIKNKKPNLMTFIPVKPVYLLDFKELRQLQTTNYSLFYNDEIRVYY